MEKSVFSIDIFLMLFGTAQLGRPEGKGRKVEAALKEKGLEAGYITNMAKAGLSAAKIVKMISLDARTVAAWLKLNA